MNHPQWGVSRQARFRSHDRPDSVCWGVAHLWRLVPARLNATRPHAPATGGCAMPACPGVTRRRRQPASADGPAARPNGASPPARPPGCLTAARTSNRSGAAPASRANGARRRAGRPASASAAASARPSRAARPARPAPPRRRPDARSRGGAGPRRASQGRPRPAAARAADGGSGRYPCKGSPTRTVTVTVRQACYIGENRHPHNSDFKRYLFDTSRLTIPCGLIPKPGKLLN